MAKATGASRARRRATSTSAWASRGKELFNLRFQLATGQLDNSSRIGVRAQGRSLGSSTLRTERESGIVPAARRAPAVAKAPRHAVAARRAE